MVFAILYRQRSSRWLNELYANIEADQNKPNFRCTSSTVLALYIRRKFFIPYWSLTNRQELSDESAAFLGMDQNQHRSSLTSSDDSINSSCDSLTFSDWIDLLFDGNFRNPISVTDWPTSFSWCALFFYLFDFLIFGFLCFHFSSYCLFCSALVIIIRNYRLVALMLFFPNANEIWDR